jgi:DNA-directed RNA polymerase subunit RPC12/RpoP
MPERRERRGLISSWWDYDRNEDTPHDISYGSGKRRWFRCAEGHPPWSAKANTLSGKGSGCPYSAGHEVAPGMNNLATLRPELVAEWHPASNRINPSEVTVGTHTTVWWRCATCGFDWQASVHARASNGHGCPHCGGLQPLVGTDDLATTHPRLAKEWHRKANGSLTPRQLTAESHRAVWWRCSACGHTWRTEVRYSAVLGTGCPSSAGKLPTPEETFADVVRIRPGEWSSRNDRKPQDFRPYSKARVWRACLRCGEEWQQPIASWRVGHGHRCTHIPAPKVAEGR